MSVIGSVWKSLKSIGKKEEKPASFKEMVDIQKRVMGSDKALDVIAKAIKEHSKEISKMTSVPTKKLETLSKKLKRVSKGDQERLGVSQVWLQRAEVMYRLDPIIFASVNKISRLISDPKLMVVSSNEADKKVVQKFLQDYKVPEKLKISVKDVILYGFSVIEKERDGDKLARLAITDPKTIDYKQKDLRLEVDDDGPIGYTVKGSDNQNHDLPRKDAVHLRLFTLGEECMGISPLEPVFKVSWIRMNLEEALGEAIYRHGYPIYYFIIGDEKHPSTPQMIKDAKEVLKDFQSAAELTIPEWVKADVLESKAPIGQLADLLTFFATQLVAGMEIPRGYLVAESGRGQLETQNIDFEKAIIAYQNDILEQVSDQLLSEVPGWDKMDPKPKLMYEEISPENKLLRARRLGNLSQRGLLTRDDSLENQIRQEENLPLLTNLSDETCVFGETKTCPVKHTQKISNQELSLFCKVCHLRKKPKKEK